MKKELVDAFIGNLTSIVALVRDAHTKLVALEQTLKEERPTLFETYQKKAEQIAQNPPVSFNLLGIENLRKLLLEG